MTSRAWATFALLLSCRMDAPAAHEDARVLATDVAVAAPPDAAADAIDAQTAPEGMLWVPPGSFTMGCDRGGEDDEHPAHRVTLAGFWLDRTPVTNEAYARCIAAGACRPRFKHIERFDGPRQPVDFVSWDDAKTFCAWAGKRLPREAEYERAMRGDDSRAYAWGNDPATVERAAFGRELDAGKTDDVGTHPAGRGPFGHDDLAGNVWEWVDDEYDPYAYRRSTADRGVPGTCLQIEVTENELRARGLEGFTGSNPIPLHCDRVLRGGAFNYDGHGLRATNRVHHPAHFRIVMAGFRCARD